MDALSDTKIRNATRPADKEYTIADGQGLIRYFFERAVVGAEGETRWPDFSIEDRNGEIWYWEHCGMLDQEDYVDRWNKKLAFYARQALGPRIPSS